MNSSVIIEGRSFNDAILQDEIAIENNLPKEQQLKLAHN